MNIRTQQVAIVTGASRGIGAAIVQRLAEDGYQVAVNYASNAQEAQRCVERLRAAGHTALAVQADVSKADEARSLFDTVERELGKELRGRQVRVNAVAPGPVATELFFNGKTPEQIAHHASMAPLERLGEPEDIAKVVSLLVGPDSGWVNGQVLRANGGLA